MASSKKSTQSWTDKTGRVRDAAGRITVYQDLNKAQRCGGCFQYSDRPHPKCVKEHGVETPPDDEVVCLRTPGGNFCGTPHKHYEACPGCGK